MASIRSTKKDINYLTMEVATYSLYYIEKYPNSNVTEAISIIEEAVNLRNELVERLNNPEAGDGKSTKVHYRAIVTDLSEGLTTVYDRLEKLIKEKAE
ncbi:MAG: hypothetical protein Q8862_06320 [Bacteroidota bacterium]|nr:hypothetical protein [Bacteroidota bacterium]